MRKREHVNELEYRLGRKREQMSEEERTGE